MFEELAPCVVTTKDLSVKLLKWEVFWDPKDVLKVMGVPIADSERALLAYSYVVTWDTVQDLQEN